MFLKIGLLLGLVSVPGCVPQAGTGDADVIVSLVNVTDFEASILVSGVAGDVADVQAEPVGALDSRAVAFTCLDELVIGDPFDFTAAGAQVVIDGQTVELDPFVLTQDDFACGDTIEVILSGDRAENLALNVFVLSAAP
jgi:hypothetical protein